MLRAGGGGLAGGPANTSQLVRKGYWPLRLALLYFPTGGGGLTIPLPLLHAELQRAATTEKAARRRFIAHLAALPFLLATSGMPEWSKSLWYCEPRQLGPPSAQAGQRRECCSRHAMP